MLLLLWNFILYKPLLNALVFLTTIAPAHDVGIAVVLLTIVVKLILFPLTQKSIINQAKMKNIEGEVAKIKAETPDKTEQAKKTFELYKANKVNPFSSCLVVLIQFPIIIALYQTFKNGLDQYPELLYSFVHYPEYIRTFFLGFIDITKHSLPLAILAGVTQFIQAHLSFSSTAPRVPVSKDASFSAQLGQSMQFQIKYLLPPFIAFIGYTVSAAIVLYWVTSNIVSIIQEVIIRKKAGLLDTKALFKFRNK